MRTQRENQLTPSKPEEIRSDQSRDGRSLWTELLGGLEWVALRVSPVYYGLGVPRGDGAPVILVPGFLATDASLVEMHLWLGRMGYRSYASGIGRNADCPDVLLERLSETIARVYRDTGRPVRLVGHSLGGLLARAVAAHMPDQVAQVITMGTPLRRVRAHSFVQGLLGKVLRRSRRESARPCLRSFKIGLRECLPRSVARATICSKGDPVVDWRDCAEIDGAVSIEVSGTHTGMPVNPQVYLEIARLLAAPQPAERPAPVELPRKPDLALAA